MLAGDQTEIELSTLIQQYAAQIGLTIKIRQMQPLDFSNLFYIPSYRIKVDAVPGMPTYAWFMADREGEYDILCTEYCGVEHAYMLAKLKIVPEQEYLTWLETEE